MALPLSGGSGSGADRGPAVIGTAQIAWKAALSAPLNGKTRSLIARRWPTPCMRGGGYRP
jgi:hypothetical protein